MGTNIPPDFWVALMDVLKAAATLSAAAFVSWAAVKLKDVRAGLHRVEHQVKNHHQTNLRDDIDRNQAATAKGIADVITQLAEIRKEQEKTAAMLAASVVIYGMRVSWLTPWMLGCGLWRRARVRAGMRFRGRFLRRLPRF